VRLVEAVLIHLLVIEHCPPHLANVATRTIFLRVKAIQRTCLAATPELVTLVLTTVPDRAFRSRGRWSQLLQPRNSLKIDSRS